MHPAAPQEPATDEVRHAAQNEVGDDQREPRVVTVQRAGHRLREKRRVPAVGRLPPVSTGCRGCGEGGRGVEPLAAVEPCHRHRRLDSWRCLDTDDHRHDAAVGERELLIVVTVDGDRRETILPSSTPGARDEHEFEFGGVPCGATVQVHATGLENDVSVETTVAVDC